MATAVTKTTVIVVGAGPAGIGMGCLLKQCEIDYVILERGKVGQSFIEWPKEMRFISPSFTGNFFGCPDLNGITPGSSPAFGLQTEHPTGDLYVKYLMDAYTHFKLDVREGVEVTEVVSKTVGAGKDEKAVLVKTSMGDFAGDFIVWAGGEFQYPRSIPNTVRVGHGSTVTQYADLPRGKHVVIGGNESGIDITHHLIGLGDEVTVLDDTAPWARRESDSSYGLSPYSKDRLQTIKASGRATFINERATTITATEIRTPSQTIQLTSPAIDSTGFDITQGLAGKLFEFKKGIPMISENDESTIHKNVFLVGPHVAHGEAIFCFIYKYRQRFAVVVREMLTRLGKLEGVGKETIELYKSKAYLLDDLSCCGNSCDC